MKISKGCLIRIELFKNFIESINIPDYAKEEIINEIYSEKSVSKMKGTDYTPDILRIREFESFIRFLIIKEQDYGTNYIYDALKYAFSYEENNCSFIDCFIRFITITNFDEINVVAKKESDSFSFHAYLGGLSLSHNTSIKYSKESNEVEFEWFHNRSGLKRTKIGTLMMISLFRYAITNYPTAKVCAINVQRTNLDAQEFYKAMGFSIIDEDVNSNNMRIEIEKEQMEQCILKNQYNYPTVLLDDQVIDFKNYKTNHNGFTKNH